MAGGDGTVRAASAIALETGLPLLVIPAGTFNHFAADLGLGPPATPWPHCGGRGGAGRHRHRGGRPFVNTSSTGVYVDLVHARQELEGLLGRRGLGRRLAEVVGLIQVLRRSRPHELT